MQNENGQGGLKIKISALYFFFTFDPIWTNEDRYVTSLCISLPYWSTINAVSYRYFYIIIVTDLNDTEWKQEYIFKPCSARYGSQKKYFDCRQFQKHFFLSKGKLRHRFTLIGKLLTVDDN